ncbi:hypothetical protein QJS10_CPB20g00863 [Acorus calamus]|uniref:Uncharacterized protein n=1 Tax=Acorus calamus TaxID=4465 RepID=A0AAV9CD24_ACOCL|nr:hypothetical protein QJS10_CPB20g00863 [Acorus calamus]
MSPRLKPDASPMTQNKNPNLTTTKPPKIESPDPPLLGLTDAAACSPMQPYHRPLPPATRCNDICKHHLSRLRPSLLPDPSQMDSLVLL